MKFYSIFFLSLLGACSGGYEFGKSDQAKLTRLMDSYVGKPINHAINKLGAPSGERTVSGLRIVGWYVAWSSSGVQNVYTPSNGIIGGTQFNVNSFTPVAVNENFTCLLEFYINERRIINNRSWQGNGCGYYLQALDR